jgi:hypothetical protein
VWTACAVAACAVVVCILHESLIPVRDVVAALCSALEAAPKPQLRCKVGCEAVALIHCSLLQGIPLHCTVDRNLLLLWEGQSAYLLAAYMRNTCMSEGGGLRIMFL